MKLRTLVIRIVCVYLLVNVSHAALLGKTVYGDGVYYFSWLRSLIIERNINFEDEYNRLGGNQPYLSDRIPSNKYSIGPALFWTPNYLAMHRLLYGDGYKFAYQLIVSLTSVSAVLFGLILLTRLSVKHSSSGTVALLLLAFGTNLFFYGSIDTVNSHAVTFFWACVYLVLLSIEPIEWFAAGIALGALAATRLQDVLYILLILPYLQTMNRKAFFTGVTVALAPQIIVWYLLYGSLINPYLRGGEGFSLYSPHILAVLFGKTSGLFLWTPVVLLGVYGLWYKRKIYVLHLTIILLQIYLVSTWSTWWQGASFSGRMFVSILPLIYLGLVEVAQKVSKTFLSLKAMYVLALSLCIINIILIISFLLLH